MSSVAVVTGASRGIGRGAAKQLSEDGWEVFATGRSIVGADLPRSVRRIVCDHTDDGAVERAFDGILHEAGRIDVLVNGVWGGYERMVEDGRFTWGDPFWRQPTWRWTAMMDAGVRAGFVATSLAVPTMMEARRGLVVHLSHWAARKHLGNVLYGVAKAATDKMVADMAHELAPHGVVVVSLYPGLVRTEAVLQAGVFDLANSESPEFIGLVVGALARDADAMLHSGRALVVAQLARDYGLTDIDGTSPRPLTLADV